MREEKREKEDQYLLDRDMDDRLEGKERNTYSCILVGFVSVIIEHICFQLRLDIVGLIVLLLCIGFAVFIALIIPSSS